MLKTFTNLQAFEQLFNSFYIPGAIDSEGFRPALDDTDPVSVLESPKLFQGFEFFVRAALHGSVPDQEHAPVGIYSDMPEVPLGGIGDG